MIKQLLATLAITATLAANAQQLQNASFENFTNGNPNNWGSFDELFTSLGLTGTTLETQVSPGQLGNFAVQMKTQNVPGPGVTPGVISSGPMTMAAFYGAPYAFNPTSFSFYYKFSPVSGDTAVVEAVFTKWNTSTNSQDVLCDAMAFITASASSFTLKNVPLNYVMPGTPDTLTLMFGSGYNALHVNTTFIVDNVMMNMTVGLEDQAPVLYKNTAYPNPASTELTITAANEKASQVQIIDITGKIIATVPVSKQHSKVDVSTYESGLYFYRLLDGDNQVLHSSKFNVVK
jgi:hypothetical protein